MRKLVCFRNGRSDYKIGDIQEIPDDVSDYDRRNFREVFDENDPLLQVAAPSDEDSLQAQLEAAGDDNTDDSDDDPDKAEVND